MLKELIVALEGHTESCKKRFITLQQREMEALADENDGLVPKVDCYGRLHAAKDGYSDVSGTFYVKGQFIPMPALKEDTFFIMPKSLDHKRRIMVDSDIIKAVETFISENEDLKCIDLSLGKKFERSGILTCYLYIKAVTKGFMNIAFDFFTSLVKERKEADEKAKAEAAAAKKALKGKAPEGKQVVIGTILGLPWVENYYGITQKVFIELENNATIYGTLPGKLCEAEIGDKVQFSANFTRADKDDTHAFFKRPTKPEFVEN